VLFFYFSFNFSILFLILELDDLSSFGIQFKTYLEYILGKPVFFNLQTLGEKHKKLKIKSREFNQFKFVMLVIV